MRMAESSVWKCPLLCFSEEDDDGWMPPGGATNLQIFVPSRQIDVPVQVKGSQCSWRLIEIYIVTVLSNEDTYVALYFTSFNFIALHYSINEIVQL